MFEPVTDCRNCGKNIENEDDTLRIDEPNTKCLLVKPRWFVKGKRKPLYDALCWRCIIRMAEDCIPK